MLKAIAIGSVATLPFLFTFDGAQAQWTPAGKMSGGAAGNVQCPAGTCAKNGGKIARAAKFCSAANCKTGQK